MSSCPSACLHASFWLFAAASISITTGGAAFGLPPEEVSLRATPDQAASRTAATEPRLGIALGPALLGAFDARAGPGARGMAQSQLTLSLPFADAGAFVFGGEIMGRFGLVPVEGGTALVGLAGGIRVGHSPRADLDVGLSLRIAHIHDAPHGAWVDHTSETLTGDPSWGLAHITAVGAALGLALEVPGLDGRLRLTAVVKLLGRIDGHRECGLPCDWPTAPIGLVWGLRAGARRPSLRATSTAGR